jgi:hypothetical protein
MKNILAFLILLVAVTAFQCAKEDDNSQDLDYHYYLYDKWWYNTNQQGWGDHFFHSDGTIEVTNPPMYGTWNWIQNDSMRINFEGYGQVTYHFNYITENAMELYPTYLTENDVIIFSTTKP